MRRKLPCRRCRGARSAILPSRGRDPGEHIPASIRVFPASHATDLARSLNASIRCATPTRRSAAVTVSRGCVRWRRAYVPGLHFAYMQAKCFARATPADPRGLAGAGLHAGLADVADPETARRIAGDAEAGVPSSTGLSLAGLTRQSISAGNTCLRSKRGNLARRRASARA